MRRKHSRSDDYDWLNDPFDEKKCAEEIEQARGGKVAGCGLVAALVAAVAFVAFAVVSIAGVMVAGGAA